MGLVVSFMGVIVAIATAAYPPSVASRRGIHIVYISSLVLTSAFLAYLIISSNSEVGSDEGNSRGEG